MTDAAAARKAFAGLKEKSAELDEGALALLFGEARTDNGRLDREAPDDLVRRIFDLAKMGPTSGNCSRTQEPDGGRCRQGKARQDKTRQDPTGP